MCDSCNCGFGTPIIVKPGPDHHHDHDHDGHVHHLHDLDRSSRSIRVEEDVLGLNNKLAAENRAWFKAREIVVLNLVSSPGSGKTTLLEKTLLGLKEERSIAVIEGDQQTLRDAKRIEAVGVPVIQINTGSGCHLDAAMVHRAAEALNLPEHTLLFIENVGNLVCPAMFDLGEEAKVVILSVGEGDDKPLKYPFMFHAASVCVISKIDLLPYVDFDVAACRQYAESINPGLRFFELSAKTGAGMEQWLDWLRGLRELSSGLYEDEEFRSQNSGARRGRERLSIPDFEF